MTSTVVDLLLSRFVTLSSVPAGNWLLDAAGAPASPERVTVEPLQTCSPVAAPAPASAPVSSAGALSAGAEAAGEWRPRAA